ncbi:hypothetical protein CAOG_007023 [Capsaspora owczarzaki ATCC 30864]|uniref:Uncharacterized protein n=1 Tax=Capsaspora owczarzaki (strain ATCC 30864) TaxID=595528 RepID=A0A0D2UP40_CAPO3|nr:hypothetical protein CAOG_007023 [Capsaspora owczarzaki ATCC 30864]
MGAQLSAHLEMANKTGVFTLQDKGILKVPPEVERLQAKLRTIDVSGNRLTALPDFLGGFTVLRQVTLDRNRFAEFPICLTKMPRLEVLSIESCGLKVLPEAIGDCPSLKRLVLDGNALASLPATIGKLVKLEALSVVGNQLTALPDEIGDLTISELNVSRNQLASLPASLARNQSLKIIKADENCLEDGSIPLVVFGDSSICSVTLEGNPFNSKKIRETPEYERVSVVAGV